MELKSEKRIQSSIELRLRKLGELGTMLQGTPVRKYRKCTAPNCPCKQGKKLHPFLVISTKVSKKTQTLYVPVAMEETVLSWVKNYQTAKKLLGEISHLGEQLVRMNSGRVQAQAKERNSWNRMRIRPPRSCQAFNTRFQPVFGRSHRPAGTMAHYL